MRTLLLLALLLLPTTLEAQPGVVNLPGGYVIYGLNELSVVSIIDDPPGLRLGVTWQPGWGRGMGKISWNRVRGDLQQDEIVLLQGKLDDRFPEDWLVGEATWHFRRPPGQGDEGDMGGVARLRHDGVEFFVPVYAPNFGPGGREMEEPKGAPLSLSGRFHHEADGCWVTQYQNDGQIITRYTNGTTDESQWVAYWGSWSGMLRPLPWPETC